MSAETGIILSKHPITDRREALYDIFYEANPKILKALIKKEILIQNILKIITKLKL